VKRGETPTKDSVCEPKQSNIKRKGGSTGENHHVCTKIGRGRGKTRTAIKQGGAGVKNTLCCVQTSNPNAHPRGVNGKGRNKKSNKGSQEQLTRPRKDRGPQKEAGEREGSSGRLEMQKREESSGKKGKKKAVALGQLGHK